MYINTLASHRHSRFLREKEEDEGGGGGQGGGDNDEGKGKEKYTPPASQEEFDRIITDRVNREKRKYADYDTYKAGYESWKALERESQTDNEKAVVTAREEAFQEAMSKTVPQAVRQAFRAEAKGVLSKEQLESLLEDLDLTRYAKDDGDPDEEKIARKVAAFAPAKGGSNGGNPGFGQGNGHQTSKGTRGEAGLAEAKRRFGKREEAATS